MEFKASGNSNHAVQAAGEDRAAVQSTHVREDICQQSAGYGGEVYKESEDSLKLYSAVMK
jgi:hypothetical protein